MPTLALTTLQTEVKNNYIIVTLDRGKANPINLTMINDLRALLKEVKDNPEIRGLILTGKQHFFTAGIDLIEAYGLDEQGSSDLWKGFHNLTHELITFPKPFVAAISGHSPAGGCVFSIAADYRIMASGKYRIGLNEIPVGIIVPQTIYAAYAFWIGERLAYQYLLEGKLLSVEHAHQVGLVDEVCTYEELLPKAEAQMQQYLQFDDHTWQSSKQNFRRNLHAIFEANHADSLDPLLEQWWKPATRKRLAGIVAMLKKEG